MVGRDFLTPRISNQGRNYKVVYEQLSSFCPRCKSPLVRKSIDGSPYLPNFSFGVCASDDSMNAVPRNSNPGRYLCYSSTDLSSVAEEDSPPFNCCTSARAKTITDEDAEIIKNSEPQLKKEKDIRSELAFCVTCQAYVATERVLTEQQQAISELVDRLAMDDEDETTFMSLYIANESELFERKTEDNSRFLVKASTQQKSHSAPADGQGLSTTVTGNANVQSVEVIFKKRQTAETVLSQSAKTDPDNAAAGDALHDDFKKESDKVGRREIIAQAIGSKLFEGYRLTGTCCETCGVPMLEQKDGVVVCVACPVILQQATCAQRNAVFQESAHDLENLELPKVKSKHGGEEISDVVTQVNANCKYCGSSCSKNDSNAECSECRAVLHGQGGPKKTSSGKNTAIAARTGQDRFQEEKALYSTQTLNNFEDNHCNTKIMSEEREELQNYGDDGDDVVVGREDVKMLRQQMPIFSEVSPYHGCDKIDLNEYHHHVSHTRSRKKLAKKKSKNSVLNPSLMRLVEEEIFTEYASDVVLVSEGKRKDPAFTVQTCNDQQEHSDHQSWWAAAISADESRLEDIHEVLVADYLNVLSKSTSDEESLISEGSHEEVISPIEGTDRTVNEDKFKVLVATHQWDDITLSFDRPNSSDSGDDKSFEILESTHQFRYSVKDYIQSNEDGKLKVLDSSCRSSSFESLLAASTLQSRKLNLEQDLFNKKTLHNEEIRNLGRDDQEQADVINEESRLTIKSARSSERGLLNASSSSPPVEHNIQPNASRTEQSWAAPSLTPCDYSLTLVENRGNVDQLHFGSRNFTTNYEEVSERESIRSLGRDDQEQANVINEESRLTMKSARSSERGLLNASSSSPPVEHNIQSNASRTEQSWAAPSLTPCDYSLTLVENRGNVDQRHFGSRNFTTNYEEVSEKESTKGYDATSLVANDDSLGHDQSERTSLEICRLLGCGWKLVTDINCNKCLMSMMQSPENLIKCAACDVEKNQMVNRQISPIKRGKSFDLKSSENFSSPQSQLQYSLPSNFAGSSSRDSTLVISDLGIGKRLLEGWSLVTTRTCECGGPIMKAPSTTLEHCINPVCLHGSKLNNIPEDLLIPTKPGQLYNYNAAAAPSFANNNNGSYLHLSKFPASIIDLNYEGFQCQTENDNSSSEANNIAESSINEKNSYESALERLEHLSKKLSVKDSTSESSLSINDLLLTLKGSAVSKRNESARAGDSFSNFENLHSIQNSKAVNLRKAASKMNASSLLDDDSITTGGGDLESSDGAEFLADFLGAPNNEMLEIITLSDDSTAASTSTSMTAEKTALRKKREKDQDDEGNNIESKLKAQIEMAEFLGSLL